MGGKEGGRERRDVGGSEENEYEGKARADRQISAPLVLGKLSLGSKTKREACG